MKPLLLSFLVLPLIACNPHKADKINVNTPDTFNADEIADAIQNENAIKIEVSNEVTGYWSGDLTKPDADRTALLNKWHDKANKACQFGMKKVISRHSTDNSRTTLPNGTFIDHRKGRMHITGLVTCKTQEDKNKMGTFF